MKAITILALCALCFAFQAAGPSAYGRDSRFDGEWVFSLYCSGCHGEKGEGVELFGPALRGNKGVEVVGSEAIAELVHMGRKYGDKTYPEYSGMPRFQYIRGGEMDALIDYLKGPLQD